MAGCVMFSLPAGRVTLLSVSQVSPSDQQIQMQLSITHVQPPSA